jgi:hemolysin III
MKFPNDLGPIYKETIEGRFPVEPWNTFSNLFFLAIFIYWTIIIYKDYRNQKFLAFSLPLLFIGFVGGTIYHATRSHNVWLFMDFMLILILCISVSVYYMIKQKLHWVLIAMFVVFPFAFMGIIRNLIVIPEFYNRMLGYPVMAFIIVFPIIRWLYLTKWKNAIFIVLGVLCFTIAIIARSIDLQVESFPMGTHWLWHSFGAFASNFLVIYIYRDHLK